jgi:hypothetical protein
LSPWTVSATPAIRASGTFAAPDTTAIRQMAVAESSLARNHFK